jgi:hypothetical protein
MLLINWLSQKQPTIELSVFGAEFVAMKSGVEVLRGIRYKLHMMGIPIARPTYVYGDNMFVIHNTQWPEPTLKKKNLSICYHAVCEAVAMGEILTSHVQTENNFSDFMMKVTYGQKQHHLVGSILFDIVCVCSRPPVEGSCPLTRYQPQGEFTPPQRLQRHTPVRHPISLSLRRC